VAVRGCFVTGTDTGAGKTILAAALCAAIRATGARAAAYKPVVTGVAEPPGTREAAAPGAHEAAAPGTGDAGPAGVAAGAWPADHELLASVTGARPRDVCARTFAPAVSPHLAAELAGVALSLDELVAAAAHAAAGADALVVEGVGGLLVPLSEEHDVRDLAVALGLPVVVAARPGLGTINHSLLTIEAARSAGLDVRAVVLTPWPEQPTVMQRSNRDTIARRGAVDVATLAAVDTIEDLASAGAALPWAAWLGGVPS
jgi:dethiobiotin synthetase